jgi:hypothetical protein
MAVADRPLSCGHCGARVLFRDEGDWACLCGWRYVPPEEVAMALEWRKRERYCHPKQRTDDARESRFRERLAVRAARLEQAMRLVRDA